MTTAGEGDGDENGVYPGFGVPERWQCWKPACSTSPRRDVTKERCHQGEMSPRELSPRELSPRELLPRESFQSLDKSPKSDLALLTKQLRCFS